MGVGEVGVGFENVFEAHGFGCVCVFLFGGGCCWGRETLDKIRSFLVMFGEGIWLGALFSAVSIWSPSAT